MLAHTRPMRSRLHSAPVERGASGAALAGHSHGRWSPASLTTTSWVIRTFDTAGEVLLGNATAASAVVNSLHPWKPCYWWSRSHARPRRLNPCSGSTTAVMLNCTTSLCTSLTSSTSSRQPSRRLTPASSGAPVASAEAVADATPRETVLFNRPAMMIVPLCSSSLVWEMRCSPMWRWGPSMEPRQQGPHPNRHPFVRGRPS
jgi:hypothetical protein